MHVTIKLAAGPLGHEPTIKDITKNIDAQERAISGKKLACDDLLLTDTLTILEAIKESIT